MCSSSSSTSCSLSQSDDSQSKAILADLIDGLVASYVNREKVRDEQIVKATKSEKKEEKKKKWRNVTSELANFRVRRACVVLDYDDTKSDNMVDDDEEEHWRRVEERAERSAYDSEVNVTHKSLRNYFKPIASSNELEPKRSFQPNRLRNKKSNKRINIKLLIRQNDLNCYTKRGADSYANPFKTPLFSSLTKLDSKLYIKYDLFKKIGADLLSAFHSTLYSCKYIYSHRKIDARIKLSDTLIKQNKNLAKMIAKQKQLGLYETEQPPPNQDSHVVIQNSLDHNRINTELNQTFDQMYLEFLISIQHREITPEDYEYLSRLDEMIKKKTVNEKILSGLRVEIVTSDLIDADDLCGVCMEPYALDEERKYLPCGHKFHSDCIDQWLSKESNCCPIDKIPLEGFESNLNCNFKSNNNNTSIINESFEEPIESLHFDDDYVDHDDELKDQTVNEDQNVLMEILNDMINRIESEVL